MSDFSNIVLSETFLGVFSPTLRGVLLDFLSMSCVKISKSAALPQGVANSGRRRFLPVAYVGEKNFSFPI